VPPGGELNCEVSPRTEIAEGFRRRSLGNSALQKEGGIEGKAPSGGVTKFAGIQSPYLS